ncbi:MAG: PilC/PilY family type IV pilus protein [Ferrimonas sp.]
MGKLRIQYTVGRLVIAMLCLLLGVVAQAQGDDTDIYLGRPTLRPQVLLLLDSSASMKTPVSAEMRAATTSLDTINPHLAPLSRFSLAKQVLQALMANMPQVDFGLALFAAHIEQQHPTSAGVASAYGGRIVSVIGTPAAEIVTQWTAADVGGSAQLCDTLLESYQYFSGGTPLPAPVNERPSGLPNDAKALDAEGDYRSPLSACQAQAYVVVISDGQLDAITEPAGSGQSALAAEEPLTDALPFNAPVGLSHLRDLPAIAHYLYQHDLQPNLPGQQRVVTYTIGMTDASDDGHQAAVARLQATAQAGGGRYFSVAEAQQLASQIERALTDIQTPMVSFTAPAARVNSSSHPHSERALYYGLFEPSERPRWQGNVKKLRLDEQGRILDAHGELALQADGQLRPDACTIWQADTCQQTSAQAPIMRGGVAEALIKQSARQLYVAHPEGLRPLTHTHLLDVVGGSHDDLLHAMALPPEAKVEPYLAWLQGQDAFDEDNDGYQQEPRLSAFGDPLHSKPLVIEYGTNAEPSTWLAVGTNHGYLHMFADHGERVSEAWAIFLPEALAKVPILAHNNVNAVTTAVAESERIYGLDGTPVAYVAKAQNAEGLQAAQVWLFIGMRRGGQSYYAIDISQPDQPRLMWRLSPQTAGFSQLGQTWSTPVITHIPGYDRPVVIVAGGYDPNKDAVSAEQATQLGREIYLIDAQNGQLLHRFMASDTPTRTSTPLAATDALASQIAVLDSDGDGRTDRLYASDTGGHIWRVDLPSADRLQWSSHLLARLGGSTATEDRRFLHGVTVAQTRQRMIRSATESASENSQRWVAYDALVIGSGDRANVLDNTVEDHVYVLQDRHIQTQYWHANHPPPSAITLAQLQPVSSASAMATLPYSPSKSTSNQTSKLGWYWPLSQGEKTVASAQVVAGIAYVPTYQALEKTPLPACHVMGQGRLYGFDLHTGRRQINYDLGQQLAGSGTLVVVPPMVASEGATPAPLAPQLRLVGAGLNATQLGSITTAQSLLPRQTYYHYGGE